MDDPPPFSLTVSYGEKGFVTFKFCQRPEIKEKDILRKN
jgi:hypothetical protein